MTNAELIDALNRLDELFSDESKWIKGAYGKKPSGELTGGSDPESVCWCLAGAIFRVNEKLYSKLQQTAKTPFLSTWNDAPQRTFADIKNLIATTRARLEAA